LQISNKLEVPIKIKYTDRLENKNITLDEARKEAFDEALANYDFGDEFAGNASITRDDNIWSCKVYLEDEEGGDTFAVSFMVQFLEDKAEIEYLSHDSI